MTEQEALDWLATRDVPRETFARIETLIGLLNAENVRQNLIAASTQDAIWARHIVDSVQLLDHAPQAGSWIDLGSGAGFPGLVVAACSNHKVTLVESRGKRATFLTECVAALALDNATVIQRRVETLPPQPHDVISARAFAPLPKTFAVAAHCASAATLWLLPKGRSAAQELEATRASWQGDFRLAPSVTDPDSAIIIATDVHPRKRR